MNTSVVTKDRVTFGEKAVTCNRKVKDTIKICGPVDNQPHKIPLTSK